jgi:hypothetical protein
MGVRYRNVKYVIKTTLLIELCLFAKRIEIIYKKMLNHSHVPELRNEKIKVAECMKCEKYSEHKGLRNAGDIYV